MYRPHPLSIAAFCAVLFTVAGPGRAEEFRVESEIYVGEEAAPAMETLTLFFEEVIYDFLLTEPEEITVFDMKRGRFVLLDPGRRLQTTVTTEEIAKFTAALKSHASEGELAFLLNPQFEIEFDAEEGWLTLSSEVLTYRAKGLEPRFSDAAARYRQFADWCARFNATRPGNLPPFARLELNKALAEKGLIPSEVERTVRFRTSESGVAQQARSRHWAVWRLSNRDRERIADVARYQASFESVGVQRYRQPVPDASSQAKN